MFERFTNQARRVVVLAAEEARRLNHPQIGTEHLLLGLVGEGKGVAAQVLVGLGAEHGRVRARVRELASGAWVAAVPAARTRLVHMRVP